MKLITFTLNGCEKVGSIRGDHVIDLREARANHLLSQGSSVEKAILTAQEEIPESMISFIEGGTRTLAIAAESEDFALKDPDFGKAVYLMRNVRLKAPIPKPPLILNLGNAYRPSPIRSFTMKPVTGVIGTGEPIITPKEISDFGAAFECELGIVIGKKGRRVPNDETAYEYVYGYTVYNDVTDYGKDMKHEPEAKLYDTFCPMGPCIATKDEIEDPYNLVTRVWVNGLLAGERSTREMLHKVPEFVSLTSRTLTLLPGTVISVGAPNSGRLRPGVILELEITGIGRMKNPVVAEQ